MGKKTSRKARPYVCVACGRTKRSRREVKCCGKDMISREKGSWNL